MLTTKIKNKEYLSDEKEVLIKDLLLKNGINSSFEAKRIEKGGNNQAFLIETDKEKFFCKFYFKHKNDTRNRLQAEQSFLHFCSENKIECVPKMPAYDLKNNLALFSFIKGESFHTKLKSDDVLQAKNFLFNLFTSSKKMQHYPLKASDACFTLKETLFSIEQRIKYVYSEVFSQNSLLFCEAQKLIEKVLLPEWERAKKEVEKLNLDSISLAEKIYFVSPSDFGFHNALTYNNNIVFLDFEYAGYDGALKAFCDFFCQPQVPVSLCYLDSIAEVFVSNEAEFLAFTECARKILPAYKVKWCFIMLNQFTKVGKDRRMFALKKDIETQQREQLKKISHYLEYIN